MAKATAGAAYRELKRVGNYIMPTLNAAADSIAANARHQKALNAAERARQQEREDEANLKASPKLDDFSTMPTGFEDRDKQVRHLANSGIDLVLYYTMEQRKTKPFSDEWMSWQDKKSQIGQDFKNVKGDEPKMAEVFQKHLKDFENGDVDDPEWLDFAQGTENFGAVPYYSKEDGKKYIASYPRDEAGNIELDEDGNPKPPIVKEWSSVVNMKDAPYKVVHLTDTTDSTGKPRIGLVGQFLKRMGKRKYDEVSGDYITTKQTWDDEAEKQFNGFLNGLFASDRTMYSLLRQATINEEEPSTKKTGFNDADKEKIRDFLLPIVKGGYDTEELEKVRSRTPSEIGASEAARKKDDKEEVDPLSQLNYDADQFTKGDYTGLLGRHETDLGDAINIREVIPAPNANYVIAVTEGGDRLEVPKTKRGFLEFKIRNKPEYKGLTPEKVMSVKPVQYRTGTIGGADISNIANDMFNAEGKPKYDDERFLKRLNEAYGITGKDEFTWSGNSLLINGKKVSTKTKEAFKKDLNAALSKPTAAELIEKYRPK